jgi:hypothetical protein
LGASVMVVSSPNIDEENAGKEGTSALAKTDAPKTLLETTFSLGTLPLLVLRAFVVARDTKIHMASDFMVQTKKNPEIGTLFDVTLTEWDS